MDRVFGRKKFEPPNHWRFGESGIITASFSRPIMNVSNLFRTEFEAGVGQRFGNLRATEVWGALYLRWLWFPWNETIRTSVAVSTGLSYTPTIDEVERFRNKNEGRGSRLLHFLSPELTLGNPSIPNLDVFVRFHHRSGGRYFLIGKSELFNNADGGAQYVLLGLRYKY